MRAKNEPVKTRDIFHMKISIHTIMYQANFPAPGRGLDLLLPSFLPSREEKKKQERRKQSIDSGAEWHTPHTDRVRIETKTQEQIFCPLRGHVVGRMQYAPTSCRQERLYLINSQEERTETETQEQKNHPLGSRGVLHTPHTDRVRIETKMQEQIFCPFGVMRWGVCNTPLHPAGRRCCFQ